MNILFRPVLYAGFSSLAGKIVNSGAGWKGAALDWNWWAKGLWNSERERNETMANSEHDSWWPNDSWGLDHHDTILMVLPGTAQRTAWTSDSCSVPGLLMTQFFIHQPLQCAPYKYIYTHLHKEMQHMIPYRGFPTPPLHRVGPWRILWTAVLPLLGSGFIRANHYFYV